jgi:hypothetical protein
MGLMYKIIDNHMRKAKDKCMYNYLEQDKKRAKQDLKREIWSNRRRGDLFGR